MADYQSKLFYILNILDRSEPITTNLRRLWINLLINPNNTICCSMQFEPLPVNPDI